MTPTRTAALKLLAAVATLVTLLVTGLGFAIYFTFADPSPSPTTTGTMTGQEPNPAKSMNVRDTIAAAPMLETKPEDASGGTPALTPGPTMAMPTSTSIGELGIPSGFPHSPEGAAAQLGEILVATFQPMDLAWASDIRQEWFHTPDEGQVWPVTLLIQGFLEQAGMPLGLEGDALLSVVPVAAQITGVDGPDWVVACVLLDITYTREATARMAYGHCERMTWTGGRWLIAPGAHPPPAPSTWPGTDLATEAGWRTWTTG